MCRETNNNLSTISAILKGINQENEIKEIFKDNSGRLCLHGHLLLDEDEKDSVKFDNKLKYIDKYNCRCEICGREFSNSEVNIMAFTFNAIILQSNLNLITHGSYSFYNDFRNRCDGINFISTCIPKKEEVKTLNSSSEKEVKKDESVADNKTKRGLSEEEKTAIIEMCNKGYYMVDIAKKLNRNYKTIQWFVKNNNLSVAVKKKDLSEDEKETIIKLYKEGHSVKNISDQLNRSYPTIHAFVSRNRLLKPNPVVKKEYITLSDEETKFLLKDYFDGYNHPFLKQKYNISDATIVRKVSSCKKDEYKVFTEYSLGYTSVEKFVTGIYKKIYKYKNFDTIDQSIRDLINTLVEENKFLTTSEGISLFNKIKDIIRSMIINNKDFSEKEIVDKTLALLIDC